MVKPTFKTKYIFANAKTGYSLDFGVCPLMYKNNGKYKSDTCPNCYSVRTLNFRTNIARKLENLKLDLSLLDDFKKDIQKIKNLGNRFIRCWSFGDYSGDLNEFKFIEAAASILPVEAFSKTLHDSFRLHLLDWAKIPNTHLSLSFNKNWTDAQIEEVWSFLKYNNLLKNIQLNYTFTKDEPLRWIPFISVFHTEAKEKSYLFNFFSHKRVCCAFDDKGQKLLTTTGNSTGKCSHCALCRLPAANKDSKILVPSEMLKIYV